MLSRLSKKTVFILLIFVMITIVFGTNSSIALASNNPEEEPVEGVSRSARGELSGVVSYDKTNLIYTVKYGDSLYIIGQRFGVTTEQLMTANQLKDSLIYVGQKLVIPTGQTFITYTVRPGDSLYLIARRYGTTVSNLKEINKLESTDIFIGQKLLVPGAESRSSIYYVQPGDTLYLIARRFGTTVNKIKELNNLESNLIYLGQSLKIPVSDPVEYGQVQGRVKIDWDNEFNLNQSVSRENVGEEGVIIPTRVNNPFINYQDTEVIIKYRPLITRQDSQELESKFKLQSLDEIQAEDGRMVQYSVQQGQHIKDVMDYYSKLPQVEWVEPNYIYQPTVIPDDTYYRSRQWNLRDINLETAWNREKGSRDVTVAILDTGIIPNHPDLKAHLLQGADFVGGDNRYSPEKYELTDNDPTDETPRIDWGSHGTHVAGIIGAVTDNSLGVAGINWNIKLLPVRVLKKEGGTSWDLTEGVYYAIDQGADIINMSLGGNGYSRLLEEAIKKAVARGITVIAAAGNEDSEIYYPAALPETIAVGAVNSNNQKAYYSNYGPELDLVAPGGERSNPIFSTWGYYEDGNITSAYVGMSGTSMATPHVSGVAALLYSSGVRDPEAIRERLTGTSRDLGQPGRDEYYGYGLLDAAAALKATEPGKLQVFAFTRSQQGMKLQSEIINVATDGSFTLKKVKPGKVYIAGWLDMNRNTLLDQGDYYGETENQITVDEGSSREVQITAGYVKILPGGVDYLQLVK